MVATPTSKRMSTSITYTTHELQIARMDSWCPVDPSDCAMPFLRAAVILAQQGAIDHALNEAQEAYIANQGNMHGVAFRIVTKTETFHAIGHYERCIKTPFEIEQDADLRYDAGFGPTKKHDDEGNAVEARRQPIDIGQRVTAAPGTAYIRPTNPNTPF